MPTKIVSPGQMLVVLERAKHKDSFQKTMLKTLRGRCDNGRLTDVDVAWLRYAYKLELQTSIGKKTK